MAKKKKSGKKPVKKAVKKTAKKTVKKTVKKSRTKSTVKRKVKVKPSGIGATISGAYHAVVDSVKGTDTLRNKMEKPGTSESE